MKLAVEKVAAFSVEHEFPGPVSNHLGPIVKKNYAYAEAIVHEFAHAAVFGFRLSTIKHVNTLSERTGNQFNKYPGYGSPIKDDRRRRRSADLSECNALAVEKIVFETLRWKPLLENFDEILMTAAEDMRVLNLADTMKYVEKRMTKINAKRAGQVITWLFVFTGTTP